MDRTFKLSIELVPESLWGKSLHELLKDSVWKELRKLICEKAENSCEICGGRAGPLHCHEIWQYDDQSSTQLLMGFEALCRDCHHVHHWGRAEQLWLQGVLDIAGLKQHWCLVNAATLAEFELHRNEAKSVWQRRSEQEWTQDFGKWSAFLEEHKKGTPRRATTKIIFPEFD